MTVCSWAMTLNMSLVFVAQMSVILSSAMIEAQYVSAQLFGILLSCANALSGFVAWFCHFDSCFVKFVFQSLKQRVDYFFLHRYRVLQPKNMKKRSALRAKII